MAQYDVTLRDYWRILRRRKGIVLFTTVLVGLFSFVMANIWKETPNYNAKAEVQLNTSHSAESMYMDYLSSYGVGGDQIETQEAVITSFPVLKIVADTLGMFTNASEPTYIFTQEDTTRVILRLKRLIDTSQDGSADIITIEVNHTDPKFTRVLATTTADAYVKYDYDKKTQQARKQQSFIEKQLTEKRSVLEQAENEVRAYREREDIVSLDAQTRTILSQITDLERRIAQLEQHLGDLSELKRDMESGGELFEEIQGASRALVGDSFVRSSDQLNRLRLQQNALLVKYTENHPQVKQLQVQIDQLKINLVNDLDLQHVNVVRELETERVRLEQARIEYGKMPAKGLELARLQRQAEMAQEVLLNIEEQYQGVLIANAEIVPDIVVLQRAVTPSGPTNASSPHERGVTGLALGMIIGIVFAVVAETMDTSIGTIEDVQEYTGSQVVGIVPFLNVDDVRASLRRRGIEEEDERALERKAQLVAFFDPQSTLAETYRTLRTNIEFVTVEKGANCLMVTSSMHGEGKSTTISNLAMTMAQLGKQTLLVDCDLRRPSLPRLFGLDKEPGLTEVIVGNFHWRDVIRTVTDIVTGGMGMEDILQTQGISNLHILTSGSIPPNPAELLNSQKMSSFIQEVRDTYDMVLFDSPPLLHVTDAAILGKKVDGAIMVYKAGDIPRTSLKRSTSLLTSVNIDLLGVVLNGIRSDTSSDFQDLSYYGYYAYGSDMGAPSRTVSERVEDYVRSFRKNFGLSSPADEVGGVDGEDEDEEELESEDDYADGVKEDEDHRPPVEQPAKSRLARALSSSGQSAGNGSRISSFLLVPFALMLVWQSGYLNRALGLIPLASESVVSTERALTPVEEAVPAGEDADSLDQEADRVRTERSTSSKSSESETSATAGHDETKNLRVAPQQARRESARSQESRLARQQSAPRGQPATVGERPAASERVTKAAEPFSVRVASYPAASRWAEDHLNRLREEGQAAFLLPASVNGQQWMRLFIGSYTDKDVSRNRANLLQGQGLIEDFVVVRLPFALQVESYPSVDVAKRALAGRRPDGTIALAKYWQPLPDGSARILSGAFETQSEAQHFAAGLSTDAAFRVVER